MEINTLVRWLTDIDYKLKNSTYKKQETFIGRLSGKEMKLPPIILQKYDTDELIAMYERKAEIINELYKKEIISEEEYKKYLLSKNGQFTPKLCFGGVLNHLK